MRILLIQPAKAPVTLGGEDIFIFEPLALSYVAAGVSGDHEVRILDMRLEKDLQIVLRTFRPEIIGITSYTINVNTVKGLSAEIKKWDARVLTVVGGHHATVRPEDFKTPDIDLVVAGEGVFAFKEIVARHARGEGFQGIPGIVDEELDTKNLQERLKPIDLDELPFPDRKLTAKYRSRYFCQWLKPLASIRTSKGCPFRCNFCALWKLAGGQYLKRKPERIVEELLTIDEEFVFFADDESLVDAQRMMTLARLIEEAGIKKRYFLYGRSDTIVRNPELIRAWKKIGLSMVFVGLEFFKDEDLKYINKHSTVVENIKAIQILRENGVDIYGSMIIRPEYTNEDFRSLQQYCRKLDLGFPSFSVLTPLPGTDFYEEVKGQMITHNYDYFDFLHTLLPTTLPLQEFYQQYAWILNNTLTFGQTVSLLRKYPFREIPEVFRMSTSFTRQLKAAYLDYEPAS